MKLLKIIFEIALLATALGLPDEIPQEDVNFVEIGECSSSDCEAPPDIDVTTLNPITDFTENPQETTEIDPDGNSLFNESVIVSPFAVPACTINVQTQTASPQPVYIRPGTSTFYHPTSVGGPMEFTANQAIELFCSGLFAFPLGARDSITITCVRGQTFKYNNVDYTFNQFRCVSSPQWTARRSTTRCFQNGILVDVGYQVGTRWLQTYQSCHDLTLETNWYTSYTITPMTNGGQRNIQRPFFSQGAFFTSRDVNNLYKVNTQRVTVEKILSDRNAAYRFIPTSSTTLFLSRGHMAAMTDFIFESEQLTTFMFINAAPQWQSFNDGNWRKVEESSRALAASRRITLEVYTGTIGITQLWNTIGTRFDIFLDIAGLPRKIPAPKLYYKILINRAANSGVVLLGVNNPHLTMAEILNAANGYIVCTDVSSRITYVTWARTNLAEGYSYACEVNDFVMRVPHLPALRVANLLV